MNGLNQAIGKTPLIKLEKLSAESGAEVYAKYEAANPGASIKDRAALSMINQAEAANILQPGGTIIEPTSGNTGIALAMIGAARGYGVVLCMPESMSMERRALLAAYGAELVLTPASEGIAGSVARAKQLQQERPGSWIPNQFSNPANPLAHEQTTGPEIFEALCRDPDFVVAGTGTGGTISGVAHYFAKRGATTRFFAVEPAESPVVSQAINGEVIEPHPHGIQGIGPNFLPEALDVAALSGALPVPSDEAIKQARWLAQEEGLLAGISSGANIAGVRRLLIEEPAARGSIIVTFLVDTGERYLSTPLFKGIA